MSPRVGGRGVPTRRGLRSETGVPVDWGSQPRPEPSVVGPSDTEPKVREPDNELGVQYRDSGRKGGPSSGSRTTRRRASPGSSTSPGCSSSSSSGSGTAGGRASSSGGSGETSIAKLRTRSTAPPPCRPGRLRRVQGGQGLSSTPGSGSVSSGASCGTPYSTPPVSSTPSLTSSPCPSPCTSTSRPPSPSGSTNSRPSDTTGSGCTPSRSSSLTRRSTQ